MTKGIFLSAAAIAAAAVSSSAFAGPEWVEGGPTGQLGDAGPLPSSAQHVTGTTSLAKISGAVTGTGLTTGDFQDMYLVQIDDPDNFMASTSGQNDGSAQFDSQLFLFRLDGTGLLGNNNTTFEIPGVGEDQGATLGNHATDSTRQGIPGPGLYYIAITNSDWVPASDEGPIFYFASSNEISGPDGSTHPITHWINVGKGVHSSNAGSSLGSSGTGTYGTATNGVSTIQQTPLSMDIKPGSCPNSFNRGSNGVLPISLLGTSSPAFDVHSVVLQSVRLSRVDNVGTTLAPHEGPPGPRSEYEDTGTPFVGDDCGCNTLGGDGVTDLSMKFVSQDVVSALHLNDLPNGALVPVKLTGSLSSGETFIAQDCLRLVPPGTPPGQVNVANSLAESWINASPLDLQLDGGGFGTFQRTYPQSTVVTLTAPPVVNLNVFVGWSVEGSTQLVQSASINVTVGVKLKVTAVYVPMLGGE